MSASDGAPPYAYDGLDRVIHEKARLAILSSLVNHAGAPSFPELKRLCGLTDGNLSRHLAVLEDAGLVAMDKGFEGKRPVTRCRLTSQGRARFAAYLDVLERVVRDAAAARATFPEAAEPTAPSAQRLKPA